MDQAQLIEHEVQIRVLNSELKSIQNGFDIKFDLMQKNFDDKFIAMVKNFDSKFDLMMKNIDDKIDNRFKSLWSIGLLIMGMLMPVFLKSIGVF